MPVGSRTSAGDELVFLINLAEDNPEAQTRNAAFMQELHDRVDVTTATSVSTSGGPQASPRSSRHALLQLRRSASGTLAPFAAPLSAF